MSSKCKKCEIVQRNVKCIKIIWQKTWRARKEM